LYQEIAAVRARLAYWLAIYGKLAFGKLAAPVKHLLLFADSFHEVAATLGAMNPRLNYVGLGCLAIRIAATGKEFTEAADPDDHGATAFGACLLAGLSHVDLFQVCPGFIQRILEGGIELLQGSDPFILTLGYFVQLFFHPGCETGVNDSGEVRDQNSVNHYP
jgi:hypothetical protein